MKTLLVTTCLSLGFLSASLAAQEGDMVQKEKARREQQLRERNAQPKAGQSNPSRTATPPPVASTDKEPPTDPPAAKKSQRRKGTPPRP